jgi:hypothetical protein
MQNISIMKSCIIENSPQFYAKFTGFLIVISILAGGFGELFVFNRLVVLHDATATAKNIKGSDLLFRLGFASYLIEAVCDVILTWIMYLLLKPVNKDLAFLSAFFGIVATATFAFAELYYFSVSLVLENADFMKTFSPNQVNSLAFLSLKIYGYGGGIFMVFYGIASMLHGYLIFKSSYLPNFLGIFLLIGGACFVIRNFALVLTPAFASDLLLLPLLLAMLGLSILLLTKGVNIIKWKESLS